MDDMDGKRTARIEIYVDPDLELAMRRRCEKLERSLSWYVNRVLVDHERMMQEREQMEQTITQPRVTPLRPSERPFSEQEKLA